MRAIVPAVVVTVLLGVAVGHVACNPQPTYVTQDRFAAQYAQALCTSLEGCCAENGVGSSYAACTQGWETAVNSLLYGPNATGNYNVTLATHCIAQVRAANGLSCQPVPGSLSAARATCQAIFAGAVPLGAPCSSSQQCAQMDGSVITCAAVAGDGGGGGGGGQLPLADPVSLEDLTLAPEDVPVCVAEPPPDAAPAAMPAPCSIQADAGTDTCIPTNNYCDPTTLTCLPFAGAMGLCDPAVLASCLPGFYCVGSGSAAGTCATAGPVGSPCTAPAMCDATGVCDLGGTQKCVAIKQPGDACTSGLQCSIGVCDPSSHTCLRNAIGTTAACNGTF